MRGDNLRPQDVLVLCKVFSHKLLRVETTYSSLSVDLMMSTSTCHEAVERCRKAHLLSTSGYVISVKHMRDLIVHAVPRVFYAVRSGMTVGMPTACHATVLEGKFKIASGATPVVWCEDDSPEDMPRGDGIEPLYPIVPAACRLDNVLYELLALCDVMRVGNQTERTIAVDILDRRLSSTK